MKQAFFMTTYSMHHGLTKDAAKLVRVGYFLYISSISSVRFTEPDIEEVYRSLIVD
ncbi:hypothetical protein IWX76_000042 [Pedobacter sp. CAN_A7]